MKNIEITYTISKVEINRRTKAYTTLIVSFFFSLVIFSFEYITSYSNISLYILLILASFLFCSKIIVVRYFASILNNKIGLTAEYVRKKETKYLIKNIKKVIIKRTSKGHIREIKIILNNKISTYINNSIYNIEDFVKELQKYLPKNVIEKTVYEPIDYDHPTFYFFLGVLISLVSTEFVKLFLVLNFEKLRVIYYISSGLSVTMGTYFILYKPIHKRDEKDNQITDYIWGGFFIIGGMLTLLSILF